MSCQECKPYGLSGCPMCETPKECPHCHGEGVVNCTALNIITEEEVSVTPAAYYCLPVTRQEAEAKREHYMRFSKEECPVCSGSGVIWE